MSEDHTPLDHEHEEQEYPQEELIKYLDFNMGKNNFAIPLSIVREIITQPESTPIPKAPNYFIGVINLRGQVVTIVDFRKKLNIKPSDQKQKEAVIIIEVESLKLGFIVDHINKVESFIKKNFIHVPDLHTRLSSRYISSVYRKEDKSLTVILNIASLLEINDEDIIRTMEVA